MNTQALEYWLDGNDMPYEKHKWGYVLEGTRKLPNEFVREIGACDGEIRVAHMATQNDCLMIVDPDAEK